MPLTPISRRQLLKVLTAAAGSALLSNIPGEWKTPVVDVGMLPVHAQGLSGFGAIRVTLENTSGAPATNSKAPTKCVEITVLSTGFAHCLPMGGTYTFTDVPPGHYVVHCDFPCVPTLPDQPVDVVAGGTASVVFNVSNCY